MAIVMDVLSNALKRNTQLQTFVIPQQAMYMSSFLFHFSLLKRPDTIHAIIRNTAAQIHRTHTNSIAGRPVKVEKKPIDPKIVIAILS